MKTGSCMCGKIRFSVNEAVKPPDACHCQLCRKFSGHFFVSSDIKRSQLSIDGEDSITWYQSSTKVRRGFCKHCGSSLFFDPLDHNKHDWTAVAMGAFDTDPETKITKHIFVDAKGKYYEITDGLPQENSL